MTVPGFDELVATARRLRLSVKLHPADPTPIDLDALLGQPLDPALEAVYRRCANGGRIWELFLYPARGTQDIAFMNQSARDVLELDGRLQQVVMFSQVGYQATHLASVPGLAASDGTQPVVFMDINEGWSALPVASSVDGSFYLLARYLDLLVERFGSVEAGAQSLLFPWDVPELIAGDGTLRQRVQSGDFDALIDRSAPDVAAWLAAILSGQS